MSRLLCCLLLSCLSGWPHALGAQGTCGPSPLGEPCALGGVAVAGHTEPGLNLGAGNPIHLATGNKHQMEIDLPAHPLMPGLEIVRHYNAMDRRKSVLGAGWALSYDTRLFKVGNAWQIVQADGSRIHYASQGASPLSNTHGSLVPDGRDWVWTWPTGRRLRFNAKGHLLEIRARDATVITLKRSQQDGPLANTLQAVEHSGGERLTFGYRIQDGQAMLDHITSRMGRFDYQYDDGGTPGTSRYPRLVGMTRPDGMHKTYLYEADRQSGNLQALTGITLANSQQTGTLRLNTWAYDSQGRAILSLSGGPDSSAGKVQLDYRRPPRADQPGLTVVTNAQQQETHFSIAVRGGRYVLTRVSGAGCPACAAPGTEALYDEQGRLLAINGTHITRGAGGHITALSPHAPGWPGLTLHYQSSGRRQAWQATLTGTEHLQYNSRHLPAQRRFQNGDTVSYAYDAQGRAVAVVEARQGATLETRLGWRGSLLTRITHPHEIETRRYNAHQRLSHREIHRPSTRPGLSLRYRESFEYDDGHRLRRHHLPEGGSLSYRWSASGRLAAIHWHDRQGKAHVVIDSAPDQAGYRYGNGLWLHSALNARGQASQLILHDGRRPVWTLDHHYDDHGRLQQESHHVPGRQYTETWRYAYDDRDRLIGAEADRPQGGGRIAPDAAALTDTAGGQHQDAYWYAWHEDGSLAARRHNGITHIPTVERDASGLPTALGGYRLDYGPARRLSAVWHRPAEANATAAQPIARYVHNAFGHRIAKDTPGLRRDYFYLDNQLVAERDHPVAGRGDTPANADAPLRLSRRYIRAGQVVVGLIIYAESGHTADGQLYAVHTDMVGAPRLVTDATQAIRWLAAYDPGGRATRTAGDLTLDLRLPGQVFDAETGWHDNLLRTYLPGWSQYLEPDPLGPVPGSQALGYAAQQPRRHVDPLGLLLFAFDGTRHSAQTRSNVWKMSQAYRDGPVFYHSGPGNSHYVDWDAITAGQASQIIENQWQSLLNVLSHEGNLVDHLPIDIIGFSRGAALARHFGNLIHQHMQGKLFSFRDRLRGDINACVDLRFMGLFDTVAQFGIAGSHNKDYDLSIASAWDWVAHAVALHERRWAFPLSSAGDAARHNVIEAPFIGAHADIGGGSLPAPGESAPRAGDLADVALNWMLWQARAASLRFDPTDLADREITDPVLHDERPTVSRSVQDGDRSVRGADDALTHYYQDDHPSLGRSRRLTAEAVIDRRKDWRRYAGSEVGTVDMNGYARWLHDELGWQPLPA